RNRDPWRDAEGTVGDRAALGCGWRAHARLGRRLADGQAGAILPAMETKAILIPAAGAARRMGGTDKLLEPGAGGASLLRHAAEAAVTTGARVIVTLPGAGPFLPGRQGALAGLPVDHLI